ncbi:MAG TPA: pitrilysin family protein [Candidatus Acidoferrales bacterium]
MKTARVSLAALLVATLAAGPMVAQAQRRAQAGTARVQFTEHRLKNGLRVILVEDHSAPAYSISVTYNVGSRDERPGRTGFAHLFEHMMFQGSENVGKGEHFILIFSNGGTMNGTTNADRTNYFQTLPANQLDLGLWLEADRMRSLAITEANLVNQRHAVQEERRLGVDNQAFGRTFEVLLETAYDNFAYKHSTIGSMEDLNAATVGDVAAFFKTYYAPNNAVLTLVGDFNSKVALQKLEKYFGAISAQPAPPEPDMTEPPQTAERRASIEDAFARTPRIDMVYKIPPGNTKDWYALSVLGSILGSGQASRLYQKLVREKEVAVNAGSGAQLRRGPSLFSVVVSPRPGKDLAEVEQMVYEEIERLQNELVTDDEMERIRMSIRRSSAGTVLSSLGRAVQMGQYAVYFNEPSLINTYDEKIQAVTKEDIQRVARTYLQPTNRTVVTTLPKPAGSGPRTSE